MSSRRQTIVHNGVSYTYDRGRNQYYCQDRHGQLRPCDPPGEDSSDEDDSQSSDDEGPAGSQNANRTEDSSEDESDGSDHVPRTVQTNAREAAARMSGLSLSAGRANTRPAADQRGLVNGMNEATGVRSAQQYGPADEITPPELRRQGGEAYAMIRNIGSADERLDGSYRRRLARFFVVGRVFSLMWAEPSGTTRVSANTILGINGQRVHQKIRRMVVIVEGARCCTALPISTHGGRGAAAPGVEMAFQGIIYSGRTPPQPLREERPRPGERGMLPHAIRVNLDDRTASLDPVSRIDYSKPHSVEQNLAVKNLGLVHDGSLGHLIEQARICLAARLGIRRRGGATDGTAGNGGPPAGGSPPRYTTGNLSHAQARGGMATSNAQTGSRPADQTPRTGLSAQGLIANRDIIIERMQANGMSATSAAEEFERLLQASRPQTASVTRLANTDLQANRSEILRRLRDRGLSQAAAEAELEQMLEAQRRQ